MWKIDVEMLKIEDEVSMKMKTEDWGKNLDGIFDDEIDCFLGCMVKN